MDFSFAIFFVTIYFAMGNAKKWNEANVWVDLDYGKRIIGFWYRRFLVLVRCVSGSGTTCFWFWYSVFLRVCQKGIYRMSLKKESGCTLHIGVRNTATPLFIRLAMP